MFIPSLLYPYIVSALTVYTSIVSNVSKFLEKGYSAYHIAFSPRIYLFCKGYSQPVLYNGNIPVHQHRLAYDADRSLFYTDIYANYKKYSLPILSIEIIHEENVVADLTNFIEEMRFVNAGSTPSITDIVMLWATLTNNYINPKKHTVRYIDAIGDSFETGLSDNPPLHVS